MLVSAEEYTYLLRGYNEKRQQQYEIARWMSYNSMMLSPFIKHKPHSPQQYAPFPWDTPMQIAPSRVTPDEEIELNRLREDFLKRNRT